MGAAAQLGMDSSELFTNEDLDDFADEKEDSDEKKPKRWTIIVFLLHRFVDRTADPDPRVSAFFWKLDLDPH